MYCWECFQYQKLFIILIDSTFVDLQYQKDSTKPKNITKILDYKFTNQGILTPDIRDAEIYFKEARDCFEKALTEVSLLFMFFILCYDPVDFILPELDILSTLSFVQSPGNELYRKSLEATDKVVCICQFYLIFLHNQSFDLNIQ